MVIANLNEQYAPPAFELITREFVEYNINHKTLGTQLDDYQDQFFAEFQNTLEKGRSLVAFDPVTENLIGVLLATDLVKSTMVESRELLSVQSPLSVLCADLKRRICSCIPKMLAKLS